MRNDITFGLYLSSVAITFTIIYSLMMYYVNDTSERDILYKSIFASAIAGLFIFKIIKRKFED